MLKLNVAYEPDLKERALYVYQREWVEAFQYGLVIEGIDKMSEDEVMDVLEKIKMCEVDVVDGVRVRKMEKDVALVCAHAQKDERCGKCGPLIHVRY